ncbi:hypothetical protein [Desulfobaculum bizertense]|uniref:hypothetical protein n=1 Tax=Desulfobaculum bizertense TaxID=376490 RepID=UPI00099B1EC5|nr:hypothetical protein [Desulfobaculum bizertense]
MTDFHRIAWDGIELFTPADWSPASLRKGHLSLESDSGPALTCIWNFQQPRFVPKTLLRHIQRQLSGVSLSIADSPAQEWADAMQELNHAGFELAPVLWKTTAHNTEHGLGLLLHSTKHSASALLLFLPACSPASSARVASAFRFQPADATKHDWEVFGIHVSLPPKWELGSASFRPGQFELSFLLGHGMRQSRLSFARSGPASLLLRHSDLTTWAQHFLQRYQFRPTAIHAAPHGTDRLRVRAEQGLHSKIPGIPRRGSSAHVWLPHSGNMLLSVCLSSADTALHQQINEFCHAFSLCTTQKDSTSASPERSTKPGTGP